MFLTDLDGEAPAAEHADDDREREAHDGEDEHGEVRAHQVATQRPILVLGVGRPDVGVLEVIRRLTQTVAIDVHRSRLQKIFV